MWRSTRGPFLCASRTFRRPISHTESRKSTDFRVLSFHLGSRSYSARARTRANKLQFNTVHACVRVYVSVYVGLSACMPVTVRLSCLVLSCHVLSGHVLSSPVPSCPVQSVRTYAWYHVCTQCCIERKQKRERHREGLSPFFVPICT